MRKLKVTACTAMLIACVGCSRESGQTSVPVTPVSVAAAEAQMPPAPAAPEAPRDRSDEFHIDDYQFVWNVAESGAATLHVVKDEESVTQIRIDDDTHWLHLTGEQAEVIGQVLSKTNAYFEAQRGSTTDIDETVTAAGYLVRFSTSPQYGFDVSIRPEKRFSISSSRLDRKQAIEFAPHLRRARALIAHVDQVIQP